jgi:SOUL heme-binding protein
VNTNDSAMQGRAPKPTSDDVRVVDAPKMTVYVGQFGGFATEDSLLKKAAELAGAAKVGDPKRGGPCPWLVVQGANAARVSTRWHTILYSLDMGTWVMTHHQPHGTTCTQADGVELNTDGLIW